MRRAGQPPRVIPSSGNGRVSFECDQIDRPIKHHHQQQQQQQRTQAISITNARSPLSKTTTAESLSSSAPSALFLYEPFSSDKVQTSPTTDLDTRQQIQSRKRPIVGAGGGYDHLRSTTTTTTPGRGESRTRLLPLSSIPDDDVTTVKEDTTARAAQPSLSSIPTTTTTSSPSTNFGDTAFGTPLPPTFSSTTTNPLSRADSNNKSTTTSSHHHLLSVKEQRRHSSEDGLVTSSAAPLIQEHAIPPKCRMVFHMRDEVSKVKGSCPSSANGSGHTRSGNLYRAGGDGGYASFRPQQQPRQWQAVPQYPLKTTTSLKTPKTVSFQEPEPWDIVSAPVILVPEKKSERGTIMITPPTTPPKSTSLLAQPEITLTRPTFESERQEDEDDEENEKIDSALPRTTATNPATRLGPPSSTPAIRSSATLEHRGHTRNLSAPSPSASALKKTTTTSIMTAPLPLIRSATASSSTNGGVPSPPSSGRGSRISRLWRSVAQKVTHSNHQSGHRQDSSNGNGGPNYSSKNQLSHHHLVNARKVIGHGSDLEPLVVMAKQ
ncbi:hypothetical protein BGZ83_010362 [Gryganskiella cystojenkinii]|nr:hypothetical protein BGZ83_010362 [Gryganskiella cystojenkinii]